MKKNDATEMGCPAALPPLWIPACAGMTNGGRGDDGEGAGMAWVVWGD